jgi:hypothetical protein
MLLSLLELASTTPYHRHFQPPGTDDEDSRKNYEALESTLEALPFVSKLVLSLIPFGLLLALLLAASICFLVC